MLGTFYLEQPSTSLIMLHTRMVWLQDLLEKHSMRDPGFRFGSNVSNAMRNIGFIWVDSSPWYPTKCGSKHHECIYECIIFIFDVFFGGTNWSAKMFRQTFWMRALQHPTPKRTILFSNSPTFGMFSFAARLSKMQLATDTKTTDRYINGSGKKRFKGNGKLKQTQCLVPITLVMEVFLL